MRFVGPMKLVGLTALSISGTCLYAATWNTISGRWRARTSSARDAMAGDFQAAHGGVTVHECNDMPVRTPAQSPDQTPWAQAPPTTNTGLPWPMPSRCSRCSFHMLQAVRLPPMIGGSRGYNTRMERGNAGRPGLRKAESSSAIVEASMTFRKRVRSDRLTTVLRLRSLILHAEIDLRDSDSQTGGVAFAVEGPGTTILCGDRRRISGSHRHGRCHARDLGTQHDGVLGCAEPYHLHRDGDALLQNHRDCQRIPVSVLSGRRPLGIGNAHDGSFMSRCGSNARTRQDSVQS